MTNEEIRQYIDLQIAEVMQRVVEQFLRPQLEALVAEFKHTGVEMLSEVRAMTDILAERLDQLGFETSSTSMTMNELSTTVEAFRQEIAAAREEMSEIRAMLEQRQAGLPKPPLLH